MSKRVQTGSNHAAAITDRDGALAAVRQKFNSRAWKHLPEEFRTDREIMKAAVMRNGWLLDDLPREMRSDKEIVIAAVQADNPLPLRFVDKAGRDKDIMIAAIDRQTPAAFNCAAESLRNDSDVMMALMAALSRRRGAALPPASDFTLEGSPAFSVGFRVTSLSGRSCCFVVYMDSHMLLRSVVATGAEMLSLDRRSMRDNGALLHIQTGAHLLDDEAVRSLGCGEMHELQLILLSTS